MNKGRIGLGRALGVAALVGLAACMPRVEKPEVELIGVRLGGLGLDGGLVYVELNVVNPNGFALVADGLTYDLDMSDPGDDGDRWVDVADGRFDDDFRVGARDTASVEIPVEFRYDGVGGLVRSVLSTGTFDYRLSGEVALDEPLRTGVPYRREGTIAVMGGRSD